MNDNIIRVTIDSPSFADPSLKIKVAALLEKALKEEFQRSPPRTRDMSSVQIQVDSEQNEQMLHTTRVYLNEMPEMVDVRSMQVVINVE